MAGVFEKFGDLLGLSGKPVPAPETPPAPVTDPHQMGAERADRVSKDQQAWIAVSAALSFEKWVLRRVETFEFLAASTVRRRMSIHFEPEEHLIQDVKVGQTVYLPLMILKKADLRNFDVRDEESRPVPVLTSARNGYLAERGLLLLLARYWPENEPLPRHEISEIVQKPPEVAKAIADVALADGGAIWGPLRRALDSSEPKTVAEIENLRALIEELVEGFLLLVPVEVDMHRRARILKLSYDAEYRVVRLHRQKAARLLLWLGRGISGIGWTARIEEFSGIQVGWAASYHAEVIPPADVYAAELILDPSNPGEGEEAGSSDEPPPRRRPIRDTHSYRPHVRISAESRSDTGLLQVHFHPQREGLVIPLFIAALVVSSTLAFVKSHHATLDIQALSALLIVPFALAAYYIRSSENSYVTRALRLLRGIALVPVACGVSILALLALGVLTQEHASEATISWIGTASWLAAWSTAILAVAWISPSLGRIVRPRLRALEDNAESPRAYGSVIVSAFILRAVVLLAIAAGVGFALGDPEGAVSSIKEVPSFVEGIPGKLGC